MSPDGFQPLPPGFCSTSTTILPIAILVKLYLEQGLVQAVKETFYDFLSVVCQQPNHSSNLSFFLPYILYHEKADNLPSFL